MKKNRIKSLWLIFICANLVACSTNNYPKLQRDAKINVQLGLAYLQKQQYPRAKYFLTLAAKQAPYSIVSLDALAYYWETVGETPLAKKYYLKALSLKPNSGRALNNYGAFLCRQKDYQHGESYLLRAASSINYIESAKAYENAGYCAIRAKQQVKAIAYFRKAIQTNPNLKASYFALARLYYSCGNYQLARVKLKEYEKHAGVSAASLWLGILIANKMHDVSTILTNGALLRKNFKQSKQYQFYQKKPLL